MIINDFIFVPSYYWNLIYNTVQKPLIYFQYILSNNCCTNLVISWIITFFLLRLATVNNRNKGICHCQCKFLIKLNSTDDSISIDVRWYMNLWGVAVLELDSQPDYKKGPDHAPCAGP